MFLLSPRINYSCDESVLFVDNILFFLTILVTIFEDACVDGERDRFEVTLADVFFFFDTVFNERFDEFD